MTDRERYIYKPFILRLDMEKRIAVKVDSTKYFSNAEDATDYAIKLLEAGLTYLEITEDNC